MSNWIQDLFHAGKSVTAMCHLQPLSGDSYYDADRGMEKVMAVVRADLPALQEGGVNGIMFSNEFSFPYLTKVEPITIAAMTRVIGELKPLITVPYGINYLRDPIASVDLAVAVDGKFIREIISGIYAPDFGLWNTDVRKIVRRKMAVSAKNLELLFNIVLEAAEYLADRGIKDTTGFTEFNNYPDAFCVPGLIAGSETDTQILGRVKASIKRIPILCNTGCDMNNITRQLSVVDGVVRAITFKYDGVFKNTVDVKRAKEFMDKVKEYRATLWIRNII